MFIFYQRRVYKARCESLMEQNNALQHMTAMNLASRIQGAMDALGIKPAEAARRCDMSAQRFNNYIKGKRLPDVQTLLKIADALEVTPNHLLEVNESETDDLIDILGRLLELDGLDHQRARTIAEAAAAANRLLKALPNEASSSDLRRIAVQAVWSAQRPR